MNIAIIGANSFLATSLLKKIRQEKNDIRLHIYSSSKDFKIEYDEKLYIYDYPYVKLDLDQLSTMDIIYFCSALGLENNSNIAEESIFGLNSFEPILCSRYLEKKKYKGVFVTFGSYFEVGANNNKIFHDENSFTNSKFFLINNYASSKRILTDYYIRKKHNINWFHFILPNLYGKGEKSSRLISYLFESIRNNKKIYITNGEQTRQYIHINDVSNLLIKFLYKSYTPSIYNLSVNDHVKIKDIVNLVSKYSKDKIQIIVKNRYDAEMGSLILDNTKIKAEFDWKPNISLLHGIKSYIDDNF